MPDYTYERPDGVHWTATADPDTGHVTHTRITPRPGKSAFSDREYQDTYVVKNEQQPATAYKPIRMDGLSAESQVMVGLLFAHPVNSVEEGIQYLGKAGLHGTPADIRKAAERYCEGLPDDLRGTAPAALLRRMVAFLRGRRPVNLTDAMWQLLIAFSHLPLEQREAGALAYFSEPKPDGVH